MHEIEQQCLSVADHDIRMGALSIVEIAFASIRQKILLLSFPIHEIL